MTDADELIVQIVVFDGFDEIDVFGPFEPLAGSGFEVRLVAPDRPREVRSQRGVRVVCDHVLSDDGGVIVPGGGWLDRAPQGAWAEYQRGELTGQLAALAGRVPFLASVCSGSMLLAHAGVLAGLPATSNPGCFEELAPLVGQVRTERVVDAGAVVTAGALTCGIDLGFWLARRYRGERVADATASSLAFTPTPAWTL